MIRSTSTTTYNTILENGLLSKRRQEVYDILYHHGPMTANEVVKIAKLKHPLANQTGFNARLSELKRMGAVIEVGTKADENSGNKCYLWQTTNDLPKKLVPIERHTRKHLEQCRETLVQVWQHPDLPAEIKSIIMEQFNK